MFAQEAAVVTLESNQPLLLPFNPQLLKWKSLWAVTNTCSRSRVELELKVREDFTITEKVPFTTRAFCWLKALTNAFTYNFISQESYKALC